MSPFVLSGLADDLGSGSGLLPGMLAVLHMIGEAMLALGLLVPLVDFGLGDGRVRGMEEALLGSGGVWHGLFLLNTGEPSSSGEDMRPAFDVVRAAFHPVTIGLEVQLARGAHTHDGGLDAQSLLGSPTWNSDSPCPLWKARVIIHVSTPRWDEVKGRE